MNNIQKLANAENQNQRLFAETVNTLKNAQGFYSRLYRAVNELDEDGYDHLADVLAEQHFCDSVDVVLWLEQ